MRPRKRFGQHFLAAPWADKLIAAIDPKPADRFLEIGPGTGALTLRLAPLVDHVTAVEVDRDLVMALRPQLPANVDLIEADFLDTDLDRLIAGAVRIAGNLPYNVATPILFKVIDHWRRHARAHPSGEDDGMSGPWRDATVMLQREVAERLEASPGSRDYGPLAIAVQLHGDVRRLLTLPPGAFRPRPKVESAVVRLTFRRDAVAIRDQPLFDRMVRSMFQQRRKTLVNALNAFAAGRAVDARRALERAGIDGRRRAETLQLEELARLADAFAAADAAIR